MTIENPILLAWESVNEAMVILSASERLKESPSKWYAWHRDTRILSGAAANYLLTVHPILREIERLVEAGLPIPEPLVTQLVKGREVYDGGEVESGSGPEVDDFSAERNSANPYAEHGPHAGEQGTLPFQPRANGVKSKEGPSVPKA